MDKLPILPEHAIVPTIDDLREGEIAFLPAEFLIADSVTHQPYVNRNTLVYRDDFEPKKLIGRFAIMRVVHDKQESPTDTLDTFVIDTRMINPYTIKPQKITPIENSSYGNIADPAANDSPETIRQLALAAKDLIPIVGLIAYNEDEKEDVRCSADMREAALALLDYSDEYAAALLVAKDTHKAIQREKKQQSDPKSALKPETTDSLDSHRPE
jgi:hypothetical protein